LDLISHGDAVVNDHDLTVPHPALTYRRFVLDPLVEIAPDWRHPMFSEAAWQMLSRLMSRPLSVELLDHSSEQAAVLAHQLRPRFPDLEFVCDATESNDVLPIRTTSAPSNRRQTVIDLRHSPGCLLEQLTSAFTVIFDAPVRVSDW
jgi:hypothetical protein